ncbi:hypothetical protein [Kaistia algarum]|uniref:hypothetical protein n=1 Tax=Kaistia algarum TaxID=2083279 RepID=UPI0022548F6C|nr:hypothetical protein [Kaistia algarum]MCX5516212.1 hypothetical protein [Kaistia algarum]
MPAAECLPDRRQGITGGLGAVTDLGKGTGLRRISVGEGMAPHDIVDGDAMGGGNGGDHILDCCRRPLLDPLAGATEPIPISARGETLLMTDLIVR